MSVLAHFEECKLITCVFNSFFYGIFNSLLHTHHNVSITDQKARVKFVQAVAEAATRPQNIEVMNNAGVMQLLRPLLLDNVPSIQQTAALALGRLANYSEDLAEGVVGNEILPQLVYSLNEQNVRAFLRLVLFFSLCFCSFVCIVVSQSFI